MGSGSGKWEWEVGIGSGKWEWEVGVGNEFENLTRSSPAVIDERVIAEMLL